MKVVHYCVRQFYRQFVWQFKKKLTRYISHAVIFISQADLGLAQHLRWIPLQHQLKRNIPELILQRTHSQMSWESQLRLSNFTNFHHFPLVDTGLSTLLLLLQDEVTETLPYMSSSPTLLSFSNCGYQVHIYLQLFLSILHKDPTIAEVRERFLPLLHLHSLH